MAGILALFQVLFYLSFIKLSLTSLFIYLRKITGIYARLIRTCLLEFFVITVILSVLVQIEKHHVYEKYIPIENVVEYNIHDPILIAIREVSSPNLDLYRFVSVGDGNRLYANKDSFDESCVFKAYPTNDGFINIKSVAKDKYLSVRKKDPSSPIRANVDVPSLWECFELYLYEGKYFAICSLANNEFIKCDHAKANKDLNAQSKTINAWELWQIILVEEKDNRYYIGESLVEIGN